MKSRRDPSHAGRAGLPLTVLLTLAGCGQGPAAEPPRDGITIACALDGAREFASQCLLGAAATAEGRELVLHRPDGGFRRIAIDPGGRYRAIDGADPVIEEAGADTTVLRIAGDAYAIPASGEVSGMYD
jgi:hypothetical protein